MFFLIVYKIDSNIEYVYLSKEFMHNDNEQCALDPNSMLNNYKTRSEYN